MRKIIFCLVVIFGANTLWAQQTQAAPQTARAALLEMFFSKTPGTFWKHLPEATRAAIEKSGALAALQQYSAMFTKVQTQGPNIQTFDSGPVMMAGEDPKTGNKFEVVVKNDTLRGDRDEIEVAFKAYQQGQLQPAAVMPEVTFSMKKEAQEWTLNEISVTFRLPLADPELLKAFVEKMKMPQAGAKLMFSSSPQSGFGTTPAAVPAIDSSASDAMVVNSMRTILTAEVTYAATYPATGYACVLSNLDGFGASEANEHQAMLISSGLASGHKHGYLFAISECAGAPAKSFQLTAVPYGNSFGRKAFCSDQNGVIRSSDDGSAATCVTSGRPVK